MNDTAIIATYFCIGFVLIIVEFAIVGPREMWAMLMDSDPNEPKFAFTKTTTPERARRDDDHFGAWSLVLSTFFIWPLLLGFGAIIGSFHLMLWLAKQIAMIVSHEKNGDAE